MTTLQALSAVAIGTILLLSWLASFMLWMRTNEYKQALYVREKIMDGNETYASIVAGGTMVITPDMPLVSRIRIHSRDRAALRITVE